jgi:diguanylate cyclase (GGDEF)-like protein
VIAHRIGGAWEGEDRVPDPDRTPPTSPGGPLARLERDREELAKAWLVRLIERASLDDIRNLPTERIAAELPELISDVLKAAGGADPYAMTPEAQERAVRLAELRESDSAGAAEVTRDVGAIQGVILDALRRDASDLGVERFAELAIGVGDAVGAVQAAAVETLLRRRSRELEATAGSDPLTGLFNLRHLQQELRGMLALHERYQHPFALLVLDIEGLRRINDARGRQAGDRVLVQVALAIRRAIRTVDVPARIGGDEFGVLMPQQDASDARALAERLAEAVTVETADPDGDGVRVAIGVVSCPQHGTEVAALLEAADQAMYSAKAGGEPVAVGDPTEPQDGQITVERTS